MSEKRPKILLTYSSGYGATKEIGEEIARVFLRERGVHIELLPVNMVASVKEYDAVIIGTSIRADRILANTRDFLSRNKLFLREKNVALFIVCLTASTEKGKEKVMHEYLPQITKIFPSLNLISVNAFGGKIDYSKMNPVMQSLVKRVVKDKTGKSTNGSMDYRNWNHIQEWAVTLTKKL